MIDALYYVHETSSPEDVEELQKMVIAKGLSIMSDPDATPTDYVIDVWVFGDVDYFPPADKYTLSPLADQGREALACDDIEGIDEVRLTEYRRFWGGKYKEMEVRRATDIFGALEQRGDGRKIDGKLSTAVFKIKFTDAPRERRLVIRTPASAHYDRNDDSIIVEAWLRARGFMLARLEGPRT